LLVHPQPSLNSEAPSTRGGEEILTTRGRRGEGEGKDTKLLAVKN